MVKPKAEPTPVPRGECTLCWPHSKIHRSFFGIGETPCECESHVGGCPPNMIQK